MFLLKVLRSHRLQTGESLGRALLQAVWRLIVRVIAMGTQRRQRARFAWLQAVRVRIVCRDFALLEPAKSWAALYYHKASAMAQ